jgi:hypothetical protein
LRPFPSKSEKTVFAANAKYFLCMQEARENGQNFKTSGSNSPPCYQMPHHVIKCPTTLSNAPPHGRPRTSNSLLPGEDLKSNSRGMPGGGGGGGGGMTKFRIDRYINHTVCPPKKYPL